MFPYLAVRPHPDRGPNHSPGDLAVHFLFTERPVCFHYFFLRVAQQVERNVVFADEILMGCLTVRGDTQNDCFEFLEFAIYVTESLGLFSSPGGVVFGIKIDDDVFSSEILQGHLFPVGIGQGESRCGLAFFDGHANLLGHF